MEVLQRQLYFSRLMSYIPSCLESVWRFVKGYRKPYILLLPPEIFLEVIKYLDHHALVNVRQVYNLFWGVIRILNHFYRLAKRYMK